jgi:hypothetical protein
MSDLYTWADVAAMKEAKWATVPGTLADLPMGYAQTWILGDDAGYASGGVLEPIPAVPKCPHCNRDLHAEPLTRRVADMIRNHKFDPTYKAGEDDSPVECVGSTTYGPNRPPPDGYKTFAGAVGAKYGFGIKPYVILDEAYTMATSYMQQMVTTITGMGWPEWQMPLLAKLWLPGDEEPETCSGDPPSASPGLHGYLRALELRRVHDVPPRRWEARGGFGAHSTSRIHELRRVL